MFGIVYVKLKDEFDAETVFTLSETCVLPPVSGSKKTATSDLPSVIDPVIVILSPILLYQGIFEVKVIPLLLNTLPVYFDKLLSSQL